MVDEGRPATEAGAVARLEGRFEEFKDGVFLRLDQVAADLRALPCRGLPSCPAPVPKKSPSSETAPSSGRSPTGTTYERVKGELRGEIRGELEEAVEEAECTAERTALRVVQERLEAVEAKQAVREKERREERRASIRWVLEVAKMLVPLVAGASIVGAVKCEIPRAQPAPHYQQIKQPQHRDAASAARR